MEKLPKGGGGYTVLPLSVRPSKIFFVALFSVTVDGRNLIFGHKRHIGIPYCGYRFWKCEKFTDDGRQVMAIGPGELINKVGKQEVGI
jgi:hypothetical protein